MESSKSFEIDVTLQIGWLQLSLTTLVLWGLWGFFAKMLLGSLNWKSLFFFSTVASIFFAVIFWTVAKPSLNLNTETCSAMLIGLVGIAASMTFYYALETGKVSIVVPLTAMYPLVTVVLAAAILREKLSLTQGVGVVLAIVAVLLISIG